MPNVEEHHGEWIDEGWAVPYLLGTVLDLVD
jgi:hypothetical protein